MIAEYLLDEAGYENLMYKLRTLCAIDFSVRPPEQRSIALRFVSLARTYANKVLSYGGERLCNGIVMADGMKVLAQCKLAQDNIENTWRHSKYDRTEEEGVFGKCQPLK